MRIGFSPRLAVMVAAFVFLWVAAFLGLAIIADGCGLELVLPWYDASYGHCD